jgi:hypothetical protein
VDGEEAAVRTVTRKVIVAGVLALAMIAAGTPASAGPTENAKSAAVSRVAAAPYCGITWGSGAKTGGALHTPELFRIYTQQATCWDRTVFEFAGAVNGYSVAYATTIPTEGEGRNMAPYLAGGAKLTVSLRAPALSYAATTGTHPVNVFRYRTLRDAMYGGSFEGYTSFAVGVRTKLPFRVFVAPGPGTHSRIIMDVAHLW